MLRHFFRWFVPCGLVLFVLASPSILRATDFHIGSSTTADNVTYFDTLNDFQTNRPAGKQLGNGDRLILYKDDYTLRNQIYIDELSSATIMSNSSTARSIGTAPDASTRFFYTDGSSNTWSKIYFENIDTVSGGYGSGSGGVIYAWWHNDIYGQGVTFRDNHTNGVGGVVYYWDALDCDLTNANFYDNTATSSGGALYVNASGTLMLGNTTNITIGATDGRTSTFSGNLAYYNSYTGTGTPNSIDFTGSSGKIANLYVKTEGTGILDMRDPFRSSGGGYTVNIIKSGTGTWKLDGDSVVNGSAGATISIREGLLELYQGASLNAQGNNDEFNVSAGASVYINGDNTITGNRVLFSQGSNLAFNMAYYDTHDERSAMLNLSGTTLTVNGIRIDAKNLPPGTAGYGDYTLIKGQAPLDAGNFELWIGSMNVDVSGRVSERFGYSLNNKNDPTELVLSVQKTRNSVLTWQNYIGNSLWDVTSKNWDEPYENSPNNRDSFIPGDTVIFNLGGTNIITLTETMSISKDNLHQTGELGMHVTGSGNWTFRGAAITDEYTYDPNMIAHVLFDGTGSLSLYNTKANTYHGDTIISGGGLLSFLNGNQLGLGNVIFRNDVNNRLAVALSTTLSQQVIVEAGGRGTLDGVPGSKMTITIPAGTTQKEAANIAVGGTLNTTSNVRFLRNDISAGTNTYGAAVVVNGTLNSDHTEFEENKATAGGAIFVSNSGSANLTGVSMKRNEATAVGGAIYVDGGKLTTASTDTVFDGNKAGAYGGAAFVNAGTTNFKDSTFRNNVATTSGGAIFYQGTAASTMTLGATNGKTSLFEKNIAGGIRNSVSLYAADGDSVNMIVETDGTGMLDMRDGMTTESGDFKASVTKIGDGTWKLADKNVFNAETTNINVNKGTLLLSKADTSETIVAGSLTLNNNGILSVANDGLLASQGGNSIVASVINLAEQATLGFDLAGYSANNSALLTAQATTWNVGGWTQNIDLLTLGKDEKGIYNLMTVNGIALDTTNMNLLYRGERMEELRARTGRLQVNGQTLQVFVENKPTSNGVTIWTNNSEDNLWNGTSFNWDGQGALENTKQFLSGDAVEFNNNKDVKGSGDITVNAGGVEIAAQATNPGMIVKDDKNYTFSGGSIDGTGGLLKQGTSTVTFNQDVNGFTGGTTIEGGTVVAKSVQSLGTGNVNTGTSPTTWGTLQFDLAADKSGTFSQLISGTGVLLKTGAGDLTLDNSGNSYSGGTVIRGGRIIAESIGTEGGIDTGEGDSKGTMVFNPNQVDIDYTGNIFGTGAVEKTGTKNLTLSGVNTYDGGTIINSGRVIATNDKALGTGNILNNGELEFALSNGTEASFSGIISGTGSLYKSGTDLLTLDAANTFTGPTYLTDGRLELVNGLALQNSTLNADGGSFGFVSLTTATLGGLAGTQGITVANEYNQAVSLLVGNNGKDVAYSGNLDGSGSVTKIGTGTQTLSGNNTFSGGLLVKEGALHGVGVRSLGTGTIKTDAELIIDIEGTDSESLNRSISGTGSVEKTGTGSLTFTKAIQNTGGTIVNQGTLNVASLDYLSAGEIQVHAQGTLNFAVNQDQELAENIFSSGTLNKSGTGTLLIDRNDSLKGTLNIHEGGLAVYGTTGAATIMESGTVLSGTGMISNFVTLKNGAAQYVGGINATSQQTFTGGNFHYEGGSTVYIKVGQYGSDRIVATDGFNFAQGGGTVNVVLIDLGDFTTNDYDAKSGEQASSQYDVFVAERGNMTLNGAVIGEQQGTGNTFRVDGVNGAIHFSVADGGALSILGYRFEKNGFVKTLGLDLLSTGSGSYSYLSTNQRAVLAAAGSTDVYDAFFRMDKESRGSMLNELMPMMQTILPFISQRGVTQTNLATFERLRFLREPLGLPSQDKTPYRGSSTSLAGRNGMHNALWFQNFGDFLRTQADGDVPGFDVNSYGFTVGYDRYVNPCSIVGIGMGGFFANARSSDSLEDADTRSFLINVYGSRRYNADWTLLGAAGFMFSQYEIDRSLPTFASSVHSNHSGTSVFASGELTKRILCGGLEFSPYLGVDWIWLGEDGYYEHGDATKSLYIDSSDTCSFLTTVGFRLGRSFRMLERNIVNPSLYLGWVHDWGDGRIFSSAAFPGQPMFGIRGGTMFNDRAIVGLNLNMTVNNRTDFFARFNAELAERFSDLSMHWGMRVAF